jgi:hypothetical protein
LRVRERDRDDAVLEAEGWEADGVVLDVEIGRTDSLAQIFGADERSKAYGEIGLETFRDGEKSCIAPDAGRTGCDVFLGEKTADGLKVIRNFEGG